MLDRLTSGTFQLLGLNASVPEDTTLSGLPVRGLEIMQPSAELAERYLGAASGAVYLIRPDQHVAARWDAYDETSVARAIDTACAKG